jgi:hypothetical protein
MNAESFNAAVRAASGRAGVAPQSEPSAAPRVGQIGIGRGGGSAEPPRPSTNELVNERLRRAARLARTFTIPGGVTVEALDDLFGPGR